MAPEKLNEETVRQLPAPGKGNRVTYFAGAMVQGAKAPRGFGVRVTAAGARAFVLNWRHSPGDIPYLLILLWPMQLIAVKSLPPQPLKRWASVFA
jgi:hypothetical protein